MGSKQRIRRNRPLATGALSMRSRRRWVCSAARRVLRDHRHPTPGQPWPTEYTLPHPVVGAGVDRLLKDAAIHGKRRHEQALRLLSEVRDIMASLSTRLKSLCRWTAPVWRNLRRYAARPAR
jgi:hypothetical protein